MWFRRVEFSVLSLVVFIISGSPAWADVLLDVEPTATAPNTAHALITAREYVTLFGTLGGGAVFWTQLVTVACTLFYLLAHFSALVIPAPTLKSPVWWVRLYKVMNVLFANYGNSTNLVAEPAVAAVKIAQQAGIIGAIMLCLGCGLSMLLLT